MLFLINTYCIVLLNQQDMYILSNLHFAQINVSKVILREQAVSFLGWEPRFSNQRVNPVLDGTGLQTF